MTAGPVGDSCKQCGHSLLAGQAICPECGTRVSPWLLPLPVLASFLSGLGVASALTSMLGVVQLYVSNTRDFPGQAVAAIVNFSCFAGLGGLLALAGFLVVPSTTRAYVLGAVALLGIAGLWAVLR
ncbi:MAG: zinc ribbon domain-containing protein [Phycisphaerae bacterium]|nr:zinc ribbon domain-containing protein [Phycisphaerae bacterium]